VTILVLVTVVGPESPSYASPAPLFATRVARLAGFEA
jgi:hypothetical protein